MESLGAYTIIVLYNHIFMYNYIYGTGTWRNDLYAVKSFLESQLPYYEKLPIKI